MAPFQTCTSASRGNAFNIMKLMMVHSFVRRSFVRPANSRRHPEAPQEDIPSCIGGRGRRNAYKGQEKKQQQQKQVVVVVKEGFEQGQKEEEQQRQQQQAQQQESPQKERCSGRRIAARVQRSSGNGSASLYATAIFVLARPARSQS